MGTKLFCNKCELELIPGTDDWVSVKVLEPTGKKLWEVFEYTLHFHRDCWVDLGYNFYKMNPWIKPHHSSCQKVIGE